MCAVREDKLEEAVGDREYRQCFEVKEEFARKKER
jgi:hypothetical protein